MTRLTKRQRLVLQELANGLTQQQIALKHHLGEQTVKYHLQLARQRLGTMTTLHAVVEAIRRGEIALRGTRCPTCGQRVPEVSA